MSQSNVEKVRNLVTKDPALQKRLEAAQGESGLTQALIKIGAEKGLPFTAAELESWKSGEGASVELNEGELKTVAAGAISYGSSILCGFCGATSGSFKII